MGADWTIASVEKLLWDRLRHLKDLDDRLSRLQSKLIGANLSELQQLRFELQQVMDAVEREYLEL